MYFTTGAAVTRVKWEDWMTRDMGCILEDTSQNCHFNRGNAIIVCLPHFDAQHCHDTLQAQKVSHVECVITILQHHSLLLLFHNACIELRSFRHSCCVRAFWWLQSIRHPTFQHPRPSFEADKSGAAGDSVLLDLMTYLEREAACCHHLVWWCLMCSHWHTGFSFAGPCVLLGVRCPTAVAYCQVLPREDVRFAAGNLSLAPRLGMSDTNLSQPWSLPRCGSNLATSVAVALACGGMNPYSAFGWSPVRKRKASRALAWTCSF